MERRLLTLLAETPIHAGGPESIAGVDLPIQREAATRLPVIWGQSLKGAVREAVHAQGWDDETALFGSPPPSAGESGGVLTRGGVAVSDAQLLLMPSPALREVFAWTTSGLLLSRLARRIGLLGVETKGVLDPLVLSDWGIGSAAWSGIQVLGPVLEEVASSELPARIGAFLGAIACPVGSVFEYTRRKMVDDVVVLPDGTFGTLAATGTDVVARVQLGDAKTVAQGPFYSEQLPPETVLTALLTGIAAHLDRLAELLDGRILQLGGDETVGKGLFWCRVHDAESLRRALPVADPESEAAAVATASARQSPATAGVVLAAPRPSPLSVSAPARPTSDGRQSPSTMPRRRP